MTERPGGPPPAQPWTTRLWILTGVRLRAAAGGGEGPSTLLFQASLVAILAGLVRSELPPWPFAVFALSLAGALLALPLLGGLGSLLRRDPAFEWTGSLPARPSELGLARALALIALLGLQALACAVPAAALAPAGTGLGGRLWIVAGTLSLALALAAALALVQTLLGGRLQGALVLLQALLFGSVLVGGIVGLGHLETLAELPPLGAPAAGWLTLYPPAWCAAPVGAPFPLAALPLGVALAGALLLVLLPPRGEPLQPSRASLGALLLRPAARLAERGWVRGTEAGVFRLVFEALPREREVILRTYPLIGIPIAFGGLAASGTPGDPATRDLLALLLFTIPLVLPVLLSQVPATASPEAVWLLESAPIPPRAVASGARKAVALRFLVPLYALLALATALVGRSAAPLELVPAAFLTSILSLRWLYPRFALGAPLSRAPEALEGASDAIGTLTGIALLLTLVGFVASRLLRDVAGAGLAALGLLLVEGLLEGLERRRIALQARSLGAAPRRA